MQLQFWFQYIDAIQNRSPSILGKITINMLLLKGLDTTTSTMTLVM